MSLPVELTVRILSYTTDIPSICQLLSSSHRYFNDLVIAGIDTIDGYDKVLDPQESLILSRLSSLKVIRKLRLNDPRPLLLLWNLRYINIGLPQIQRNFILNFLQGRDLQRIHVNITSEDSLSSFSIIDGNPYMKGFCPVEARDILITFNSKFPITILDAKCLTDDSMDFSFINEFRHVQEAHNMAYVPDLFKHLVPRIKRLVNVDNTSVISASCKRIYNPDWPFSATLRHIDFPVCVHYNIQIFLDKCPNLEEIIIEPLGNVSESLVKLSKMPSIRRIRIATFSQSHVDEMMELISEPQIADIRHIIEIMKRF